MSPSDKDIKPISVAEVKDILTKVSKEREELMYEQKIALEHAQKFGRISVKDTKNLIKDLMELKLFEEKHAYKIADLLPLTNEEITAIFAKEKITISEDKANKIIETIKKYY